LNRVTSQGQAEEIARAYEILPVGVAGRLRHVEFLTADPVWAGLHYHVTTSDHRSYRSTAHCSYGYQQTHLARDRRATTIVLPKYSPAWVVVHELGHALHEVTGFDHTAQPVSRYAQTNRWEAFAEAVCAWLLPEYRHVRKYLMRDPATVAFLENLA
jgi:hypothetical protein